MDAQGKSSMDGDGNNSSQSAWLMIQTGLSLSVIGAMAVGLWWLRMEALPAYQRDVERGQLVALGDQARGHQPLSNYHEGDWIRVRDFAPARTVAGQWVGMEKDSVLVVRGARAEAHGGDWVQASNLGQPDALPLTMHESFVERYEPAVLAGGLEISDCHIHRYVKTGGTYYSVSGELRNGTDQAISRCEVVCRLHNAAGEPLVELRSAPMGLAGEKFGEFETAETRDDAGVAAFSLKVRYEKAGHAEESPQVLVNLRPMPELTHE
jgi:hypothetical protein